MSQLCDIRLERPSGVYYSGETVNGYFSLTLPERALIKGKLFLCVMIKAVGCPVY